MTRLPEGPDITPKHIWNPLIDDFTTTYANEDNIPIPYTCPSLKISQFPTYIANHIAKQLAQKIVFERGIKTNYEDEFAKTLDEITITI